MAISFDFTTFTEVDNSNRLVIDSATQISMNDVDRDIIAYIYYDFGFAAFSGDFNLKSELVITQADSYGGPLCWCLLSNTIGNAEAITSAGGDFIDFEYYGSGNILRLVEVVGGSGRSSAGTTISDDTTYYLTFRRDESVGTYGTIYLDIHTDSARTNLLATESLALSAEIDFSILYPVCNRYTNTGGRDVNGTFSNLTTENVIVYPAHHIIESDHIRSGLGTSNMFLIY